MIPASLTWRDVEALAQALAENYPGRDPLRVPPAELRGLIARLPGFVDLPSEGSEADLEEVQSAWFDAAQE